MTVCLAVEALLGVTGYRLLAREFIATTAETQQEAVGSSLVLREALSRTIDQIRTLQSLAKLVTLARHDGNTEMEVAALDELTRGHPRPNGDVLQVSGFSVAGNLLWSNHFSGAIADYMGDRARFQDIAAGRATEAISRQVLGRPSGQRMIHFLQGVYDPQGSPIGITAVSVNPDSFVRLLPPMGFSGLDVVTIVRADGAILARLTDTAIDSDLAGPNRQGYIPARDNVPETLVSPIDGVERIHVSQHIDGGRLILIAGLDLQARIDRARPKRDRIYHRFEIMEILVLILGTGSLVLAGWYQRAAVEARRTQAMQDSESLFRQLAESLPDMIQLQDGNGVVLYANPAAQGLPTSSRNDPAGPAPLRSFDLSHNVNDAAPSSKDRVPGRRTRTEFAIRRADGSIAWLQTDTRAVRDETRKNLIVCSSRDITRRRNAAQALRQARDELEAVLTAMSMALFTMRIEDGEVFRTIFVSDSVEPMAGYATAEVVGTPNWLLTRVAPGFQKILNDHRHKLLTAGRSSIRCQILRKDGTPIWVEVSSRATDQEHKMIVSFIRDVTRIHNREQELAKAATLATLGEMTTSMAHELRQPLTAVSMMVQNAMNVLDAGEPAEAFIRRKMERIIEQIGRAATIVDHMRVFGRKDHGPPVAVSVASALDGTAAIVRADLRSAEIDLIDHVDAALPPISGHLVSLQQVLMNLISNAADAIRMHVPELPRERRRIEITAGNDARTVVICVTDHAGGIDETVLPRLFEPFFTTKPAGSGVGLGLSVSYGIITGMGGTISARNTDDGAVFEIRLPAVAMADASEPA